MLRFVEKAVKKLKTLELSVFQKKLLIYYLLGYYSLSKSESEIIRTEIFKTAFIYKDVYENVYLIKNKMFYHEFLSNIEN